MSVRPALFAHLKRWLGYNSLDPHSVCVFRVELDGKAGRVDVPWFALRRVEDG